MAILEGKSHCITPFCLYPAGRISGHGPAGLGNLNPKLSYPQAKLKLMGGPGGRVLIVKAQVMVGGELGRRSITGRAPAELGPSEMNACVNVGVGWWSAEMQRD